MIMHLRRSNWDIEFSAAPYLCPGYGIMRSSSFINEPEISPDLA